MGSSQAQSRTRTRDDDEDEGEFMRFEELEREARRLMAEDEQAEREKRRPRAVGDSIRGLAMDIRFAGVVALLLRHREGYQESGCAQGLAADHGRLAHCQGAVHAMRGLVGDLRQVLAEDPRKGRGRPVEVES